MSEYGESVAKDTVRMEQAFDLTDADGDQHLKAEDLDAAGGGAGAAAHHHHEH